MENTRKRDGTFVNGVLLIILIAGVCERSFLWAEQADVSWVPPSLALCEVSEAGVGLPLLLVSDLRV